MTRGSQGNAADSGASSGGGTSLSLLQRVRANDQEAWRQLVHLYTPLVCHWCGREGISSQDTDDLVQEVFQAASQGLARFRHDRPGDSFRGWLRGITRVQILVYHRRTSSQPQAPGGTDALKRLQGLPANPSEQDEDDHPTQLRALYHRALALVQNEFEERTWRMFWQTAVNGRSPVDVAADLGASPAAVRKAKSRVLHRLKEQLGDVMD
jgi:RNA polymerase sigma-70 factor (ECF subfamily)